MSELIRGEIHRQSGIPNLEDYDGAGASGKTLTKFIYMMELFTDPKEAYFKQGLIDRIDCLNRILTIQGKGLDLSDIHVIMNRNRPDASLEQAEIFEKYDGRISRKTLIENFADFVDNADEEMEQLKAEKEENLADFGFNAQAGSVPPDEDDGADGQGGNRDVSGGA
jgi:SPP1 family phage portal protein